MGRFGILFLFFLVAGVSPSRGEEALADLSLRALSKRSDVTVATSRSYVPSRGENQEVTLAAHCQQKKLRMELIERDGHTLAFLSPKSNVRLRKEWLGLADSEEEDDRCVAARWLYGDGSREAVVKALELLQDKSPRVRTYAAVACTAGGTLAGNDKVHPYTVLAPKGTVEAIAKDLNRLAAAHRKGCAGRKRFAYLRLAAMLRDASFLPAVEAIARWEIAERNQKLREGSTIAAAIYALRMLNTPEANAALIKLYKDVKAPRSHYYLFDALLAVDHPEARRLLKDALAGNPEGVDKYQALSAVCGRVQPWANRFRGRPQPWAKPILLKMDAELKTEIVVVNEEVAELKKRIKANAPQRERLPLVRAQGEVYRLTRQQKLVAVAIRRMTSKDLKKLARRDIEAQTDPGKQAQQLWDYAVNHWEPDKWSHELCRKLAGKGGGGQATALSLLARFADPDDVKLLADMMKGEVPRNQRNLIIRALTTIGTKEALDLVAPCLKSEDKGCRAVTAQYIGRYGRRSLAPALRQALSDPESWVRASAARALGAIGTTNDIPALLKAADGPKTQRNPRTGKEQPDYYRSAETALVAIGAVGGPEAVAILTRKKALLPLLKSPHIQCREAARALAKDSGAVAAVLVTRYKFNRIKCNEVYYLVPALIQLARANEPKTRLSAIEQLHQLTGTDPRAIEELSRRAMRDTDPLVRFEAVKALYGAYYSVADAKAAPALITIHGEGSNILNHSVTNGIFAIGADGGPEAVGIIEAQIAKRRRDTL